MKSKATITFRFYEDEDGMQKFVHGQIEPEEVDIDPNQGKMDFDGGDAEQEDSPDNGGGAEKIGGGDPLILSAYDDGLFTGRKFDAQITVTKGVMKDLLDAEAKGLRATFSLTVE